VPDNHAAVLRAFGPEGSERAWHLAKTLTRKGRFEFEAPLALDAPKGRWTVTVTDAVTGMEQRAFVEIP
jgi:hypothetical protein